MTPTPPEISPETVTREMVIQRMIVGFTLRKAPHMGDTCDDDFRRWSSQLLGGLGICHFDLHQDFISSDQPLFCGRGNSYRGISPPCPPEKRFVVLESREHNGRTDYTAKHTRRYVKRILVTRVYHQVPNV